MDYPPSPAPSHAQRVAALELLAQAMDPSGQARLPGLSATAEEAVAAFDAAELEAQHAQQEKERLQGLHRGASEQTSHLQHEVGWVQQGGAGCLAGLCAVACACPAGWLAGWLVCLRCCLLLPGRPSSSVQAMDWYDREC